GGESWHCVGAEDGVMGGAAERAGSCAERIASLPAEYLLALDVAPDGTIWVGHTRGLSYSRDRGRSWRAARGPNLRVRVRDVLAQDSTVVWALTEDRLLVDSVGVGQFREVRIGIPGFGGLPG